MDIIGCICHTDLLIKLFALAFVISCYAFYIYGKSKSQYSTKNLHPSIAEDSSSNINPLTKLPSRCALLRNLHNLLPNTSANYALLIIDVDNFSVLNEAVGPSEGDKVIKQIAGMIQELVIAKTEQLYHFSADEFAIFMPLIVEDLSECTEKANKILEKFSHIIDFSGYKTQLTVSIGICVYPNNAANPDDLLQNATKARYHAKQLGKNTYSCYTQDMHALALERTLITSDLTQALDRREFSVYYQPKIELATGNLAGAEALLRWQHEKHGFVSPEIFIPVAEDLGIINAIGNWSLEQICHDIQILFNNGFKDIKMAVNFSAIQFNQSDLALIFANILDRYGLPPSCLEIEITERTLMSNSQKAKLMLKVLNQMGVSTVVDDFSMGHSSLSYLKDYTISSLKIDKFFIKGVYQNKENSVIVKTIISMAHQLGIKVVAEGVETKAEEDFLKEIKCDYIQGYYHSKPLPFTDYLQFIQDRT